MGVEGRIEKKREELRRNESCSRSFTQILSYSVNLTAKSNVLLRVIVVIVGRQLLAYYTTCNFYYVGENVSL